jgi:hypothetical protein
MTRGLQLEVTEKDAYLRNLVGICHPTHTRLTYHRTWETGLRVAIRVTAFSPAFFCPGVPLLTGILSRVASPDGDFILRLPAALTRCP